MEGITSTHQPVHRCESLSVVVDRTVPTLLTTVQPAQAVDAAALVVVPAVVPAT